MFRKNHQAKKTAVALNLARQVINRGGRVVWVNEVDPGEPAAAELRHRLRALGVSNAGDEQFLVIDHLDFVPIVRSWTAGGDADGLMIIVDESDVTTVHCPLEC